MMTRSLFLLCCLTPLLPAAPAPLPRVKKSPNAHQWSAPANGLRIRLVPVQTCYQVGQSVKLYLELQNVSGSSLSIEEPDLPYAFADRPSRADNWSINCVRVKTGDLQEVRSRCYRDVQELRKMRSLTLLADRQIMRIEITGNISSPREEKESAIKADEPRRAQMRFYDGDLPGVYELRATYNRPTNIADPVRGRGEWTGDGLISPPIRVEIRK